MASLSQCRCLAGARAFTGMAPRQANPISNGCRATMKRRDSYWLEVTVGEDEPEDIAVRKFMTKIMDSRLLEELRHRRYKETPLIEYKRRTQERIAARKMGLRFPTYEEEYGIDEESKPFASFFQDEGADTGGFNSSFVQYKQDDLSQGGYINDGWGQSSVGGTYMSAGGYMQPATGGYMSSGYSYQPQQGYYGQQGGYAMQDPAYNPDAAVAYPAPEEPMQAQPVQEGQEIVYTSEQLQAGMPRQF